MELLKSDYLTMVDLFFSAKKQIILSVPGITDIIAKALVENHQRGINLFIHLEFNESSFRSGFCEIKAIEELQSKGIKLFDKEGINIYFVIIDDTGYFYFPKSQFFEEEGQTFDLYPMEKMQVKTIKLMYSLLEDEDSDYEYLIDSVGVELLKRLNEGLKSVDQQQSQLILTKLKSDPPLKPNFGRTLETYKAKFQVVELKFKGANLHTKKVQLPHGALPFMDDELKRTVEANLRLFTDLHLKEYLQPFFLIKEKLEMIRKKYHYHIKSREKSLIIRDLKGDYEDELNDLKISTKNIKEKILNELQDEINNSRDRVGKNLYNFLIDNPPEQFKGYNPQIMERGISNEVNKIVGKIKFPNSKDLLEELKFENHYYDITWEDLHNKEVLDELLKHGLITKDEKSYISELAIGAKKE